MMLSLVVLHLSCLWHASATVHRRSYNGTQTTNGILVSFANSAQANSAPLVSTHVSFSIEQDRWPDWVGTDERNEFTFQALDNLQQLTGQPPKIRVGANSEDRTVWSPTVTIFEEAFPPPSTITPYPEASTITVGDGFYQLSQWLPSGTHMTWGVNFGLDNVTNAVNMAKSIVRAFGTPQVQAANVYLDFLELGNEADFYKHPSNGLRPSNWTAAEYVADWISIAGPLVDAAPGVPLQGASFASGGAFTPTIIFNDGILNSPPGRAIKQISQHHYSGAFCQGGDFALATFMNKAAIRGNLTGFSADIAAVQRQGMPYVLGETNSIACHGAPGVSNTAGAALWAIDYTLQAATLGIVETFFHEGIGFKYNFLQPVALDRSTLDGAPLAPPQAPHVQPAYYAAVLVARAAGRTGAARVAELAVPHASVAGYAVYEGARLVRAVFVNLDAWLASSAGARPSVHIDLGLGLGPVSARVRRMAIRHADDVAGVTLGGQSYETPDARPTGAETLEVISVDDGVDVASTEAILLEF